MGEALSIARYVSFRELPTILQVMHIYIYIYIYIDRYISPDDLLCFQSTVVGVSCS